MLLTRWSWRIFRHFRPSSHPSSDNSPRTLEIVDDELERPTLPIWIWLIVALLAVIGAITVVGWVFGALMGIVKLAVVVVFIALVIAAARSFTRRR